MVKFLMTYRLVRKKMQYKTRLSLFLGHWITESFHMIFPHFSLYIKSQYSCKQIEKGNESFFFSVCTGIHLGVGSWGVFADFKAETPAVELSVLWRVMCAWRGGEWRTQGERASACWVTQGRCWSLLGLELEVDAGSRHWIRTAPPSLGSWSGPEGLVVLPDCHYGRNTFTCCSGSDFSEKQAPQRYR